MYKLDNASLIIDGRNFGKRGTPLLFSVSQAVTINSVDTAVTGQTRSNLERKNLVALQTSLQAEIPASIEYLDRHSPR